MKEKEAVSVKGEIYHVRESTPGTWLILQPGEPLWQAVVVWRYNNGVVLCQRCGWYGTVPVHCHHIQVVERFEKGEKDAR